MSAHSPVPGRAAELLGRDSERGVLDRLLDAVRAGEGKALVLLGEPGVGKTALLDYLARQAAGEGRVIRAAGMQSEMELAFAGLQQLCAPMLDNVERLPPPQRAALRTAFGISNGPAPDRFLVGMAVLNLVSEAAEARPLVCLVDDQQWLDRASAQVLGFMARRLAAEPIGVVFAARVQAEELAGLPELVVEGLHEGDARALLDSVLTGSLDERVRDRIVAETRGNPLALLLVRGLTPTRLAGGFGLPSAAPIADRVEEEFFRRVEALPVHTRRLLLLAAADPTGDPGLVWQAAGRLGIDAEAATPAAEAGLVEFGTWVRFRHPLVRSTAYLSALLRDRQGVHRALAEVTDARADPDRRAWHLAQAAPGPEEDVAGELERSAGRAQARGGMAAAAAFLERAAVLTPDPVHRAQRLFASARAKRDAGELGEALGLLVVVEAGPPDALRTAELEHLRGQIALVQRRAGDGTRLLLSAARRLEPHDVRVARETYLEALEAALWAGDLDSPGGLREAAEAARGAPPGPQPPRAADVLLDAFAMRLTQGYSAAAPMLTRALEHVLRPGGGTEQAERWLIMGRVLVALELWDAESAHALAAREAQVARDTGAPLQRRLAVNLLASGHVLAGELATAAELIEEDRLIGEVTGIAPVALAEMMLTAWRGQEALAAEVIGATTAEATAGGVGRLVDFAHCATSVLYNGLGRYDAARAAARRAFERDQLGYGPFVVPELAEAASRTGDVALVKDALTWLSERTRATPTEWALGTEAGVRALVSEGDTAEGLYRESIDRLGRTQVRAQLGRAHLLYGEWLRRHRRRTDAREELGTAHDMLDAMGIEAFAERARRELAATGETARKRTADVGEQLTAQEAQVARLARDGLSNPEIGARLFLSARTVQYHLSKVFAKLGISSRSQLDQVLPADSARTTPQ